jgi:hypothetical protein
MCRPPCCRESSHEGAGIAAVAVVIGSAAAYDKIGPALARIWHIAVEALTIFTLACAAAAAGILVTWATAHYIRTRRTRRQMVLVPVPAAAPPSIPSADRQPHCLACGDTGTVLRAIAPGPYQNESCTACQPVHRAG